MVNKINFLPTNTPQTAQLMLAFLWQFHLAGTRKITFVYEFGRTFGVLTEASLFMESSQIFSTHYTKKDILDILSWLNITHVVSRGN